MTNMLADFAEITKKQTSETGNVTVIPFYHNIVSNTGIPPYCRVASNTETVAEVDMCRDWVNVLFSLYDPEETEDQPTTYSYTLALKLLMGAYRELTNQIPKPIVANDGDKGIYISWYKGNKLVRLGIPKSKERQYYIYHRERKSQDTVESNIVYSITAYKLKHWLSWLTANE